ncbi:MAG TPA: hypothetical protein VFI75_03750 [Candidatus Acidoferrum sp.]|jgi:hypothetical protein|nr:hypothetical protein [Candidatus Acidoferrum sp.]
MPNQNLAVSDAEHRAWSYWFADGLPNLLGGVSCLLLSGAFLLLIRYRHTHSLRLVAIALLALGLAMALLFRLRQSLEWLKARITYRRTGYAAPPYFTFMQNEAAPADLAMLNLSKAQNARLLPTPEDTARGIEDRNWRAAITLGVYLAAFLSAALIHQPAICGGLGTAAALIIWLSARKNERLSWAVAFGLPYTGLFIFILAGTDPRHFQIERLAFFLAGAGLLLTFAGAITFAQYLRRNPAERR